MSAEHLPTGKILEEHLDFLRILGRSGETVDYARRCLKDFAAYLNPKSFLEASEKDISEYLNLVSRGRSQSTVYRTASILSGFYKWCCRKGYITNNPALGIVKRLGTPKLNTRSLSHEEKEKLLSAVKNPRDMALIGLMLYGGLSLNEVVNLTRQDIVFAGEGVFITAGYPRRVVYFEDPLAGILRHWNSVNMSEHLLPNRNGEALGRRGMEFVFALYEEETGIADLSPQVLKNTFCRDLLEKGMDPEDVAAVAGYVGANFVRQKFGKKVD